MRLSIPIIAALLGILSLSCKRDISQEFVPSPSGEECVVSFTLEKRPVTKSILPSDIENRLDNAFVLLMSEDGYSRYQYFDFTQPSQESSVEWRMPAGKVYNLYAVGNMGNILSSLPRTEEGFNVADFRYEVPSYTSLKAMPMALCSTFNATQLTGGSHLEVPIRLERLMARVNVRINKSGITGGSVAEALQSASIHLRQVARALYPFRPGGSLALSDSDVFSSNTDYYVFPAAEAWNLDSGEITLYVPENKQGRLLPPASVQADKSGTNEAIASLPQKKRLTYVEYASAKKGTADGVSGSLVYRGYLGANETNDFSIERNRTYTATLSLTWDGFTWQADGWRIDRGNDWTDARRLAFLDAEGNPLNYLKIHKKGSGEAYAYFAIDGDGSSGTAGRKDVSSYPYGWYLTGNAIPLSGHDGSGESYTIADGVTVQCLGAATVNGKAVTKLRFSASAAAAVTTDDASLRHLFVMHTMDDALNSEELQLDIEELPFQFRWIQDGNPTHVAQKGTLCCIDPYTGELSAEGRFNLKEGYTSKVRITNNNDGTAGVSIIGPFTQLSDAISITDADGDRRCDVPLEGRLPWFTCSRLWTTYIDASVNMKFTYWAAKADGTQSTDAMKVSETQGWGDCLDRALVEELIAPVTGCRDGKLGFSPVLASDGTYLLSTYVATYGGITPSGSAFNIDEARVSMKGYNVAGASLYRGLFTSVFQAYNPWKNITQVVQGAVMNDYTLYCAPRRSAPFTGWDPNPEDKPEENTNYSMDIQNPVVANVDNLTFNVKFANGLYLGNICSSDPSKPLSKTAANFNPSTWTLILDINDPVNFDKARIREYLYAKGFQFVDSDDMDMQMAGYGYSFIISSGYASKAEAWANAPLNVTESTSSTIQGTTFRVISNESISAWRMNYGMKGIKASDISRHCAGKVGILLQLHNPHDGSYLEKAVGEAYMRLHVYLWPRAYGPQPAGSGSGWEFGASLFTPYTNIFGLENLLGTDGGDTMGALAVASAQEEVYTKGGTAILSWTSANEGVIGGFGFWKFPGSDAVDTREKLMDRLVPSSSYPFLFKSQSQLNAVAKDCFYRTSSYKIRYDPSGQDGTYTVNGQEQEKLFVICLGSGSRLSETDPHFYFDP